MKLVFEKITELFQQSEEKNLEIDAGDEEVENDSKENLPNNSQQTTSVKDVTNVKKKKVLRAIE